MTSSLPTPLQVAARVAGVLEALDVRYSIGGSLASSFSGEPRSTLDVDVVVALDERLVRALVAALGEEFYADENALRRAVLAHGSANLIHLATSIKVDLFMMGGSSLDEALLDRRIPVLLSGPPPARVFVHTPEDILLQKLRWFRLGGEVSDRQWRDVLGILRAQANRLDGGYMTAGAERLGVSDLLARALKDSIQ